VRLAILRQKAKLVEMELPEEIMSFLANRIRSNIRRLEGALTRVTSYAALTSTKLSLGLVGEFAARYSAGGRSPLDQH